MIGTVDRMAGELGVAPARVCRQLPVPYSTVMRWRQRRSEGKAPVGKPGPAKTEPLNQEALEAQVRALEHGRKRTRGTGALYQQHREEISRRDLQALVARTRREINREADALLRRVDWLLPGVVWSMDDSDVDAQVILPGKNHTHMHMVHDLGSHYTLNSSGSVQLLAGAQVGGNLEELFREHGTPLFLKRDNGSNLTHQAVTAVLDAHWVIALNSPPRYPPYNGAVERKQLEMQRRVEPRLAAAGKLPPREIDLHLRLCGHELNHIRRDSLHGATACRAFDNRHAVLRRYGRRERKEAYDQIRNLTVDIWERLGHDADSQTAVETAFRYAAETWMQQNNIIRVTQNGKVLPPFYRFQSH